MVALPDRPNLTPDEYLAAEAKSPVKHEYHDGEVYAMAGASDEHVTIAANLTFLLLPVVRKRGCRLYNADMKVHVQRTNRYFYPDLLVTCDPRDRENRYIKEHPKLVIEILSDSTEAFDRGDKFHHYCQLDSLTEYVLISQNQPRIDVLRRGDTSWHFYTYTTGETLRLNSIEFEGAIESIYEDITFPTEIPIPADVRTELAE